jgi:glycosyltransferase involved in cell wall biosynthesis
MSEAIVALVRRLGVSSLLLANSQQVSDALPLLRREAPKVRVVVQAHNFETNPETGELEGQAAYVASRFNNLVAGYTAISSDTESALTGRLYVSPSKIRRVYLGIDTQRFAKAQHACFEQPGPMRVLWLGRLCHQKDPMLLVRIASLWSAKHGTERLRFDMVGAGDLAAEVRAAVAAENLSSIVTLHGAVDDPVPHYRTADCLMLTSRYEGIPVVVFEAMAAGLPIITPTEQSAVKEALDPSCGFFIENRADPAEYVAALERLIDEPSMAKEKARNAVRSSSRFDIRRYADETLEVLDPAWRPGKSAALAS